MKVLIILLALTLLVSGCAGMKFVPDKDKSYDTVDKVLWSSMASCQVYDGVSTSGALSRGGVESNPLYGSHPSDGTLVVAKGATILGITWAANRTSGFIRKGLLGFGAVLGCGAGIHNDGVGRD